MHLNWNARIEPASGYVETNSGKVARGLKSPYKRRGTLNLGTGMVGLEFEAQDPAFDSLLVAVGAGGLIGGIAAWYEGRIWVFGVEPVAAPTLTRALEAGHLMDAEAAGSLPIPWPQTRGRVDVPDGRALRRAGGAGGR
jgi:hypothetical protein